MTAFVKEEFIWDGMYLMYRGNHDLAVNMEVAHPDCHPSWVGKPKPTFVARFKYGYKPWRAWVNWLCKNITVEEYVALEKASSPVHAMRQLGYKGKV
jgi:hypothetical protein